LAAGGRASGLCACGGGSNPQPPTLAPPVVIEPTPRSPGSFPDTDPDWLRALAADYPYAHELGNVRVFLDISPAFSIQHAEHLRLVWRYFDQLYARNRGEWIAVYYTRDRRVFDKAFERCPTTVVPGARLLTECVLDFPRWFVMPYEMPDLATLQHEIGHDFLIATWWGSWQFPRFKEGTAMYFEGGSFDAGGTLQVREPHPYCTTNFRTYDKRHDLVPLERLVRLPREEFLATPRQTYSQSCLLFHYLQDRHPGVLPGLIDRINSGAVSSNEQLLASLVALTGQPLEQTQPEYEAYGRSQ
jgi:hypothetical protein